MIIALWSVQILLALAFFMAGLMKVTKAKEELQDKMAYVEDFSQGAIRLIGTLEILGAIGLVLPVLTGVLPWLTPLAAIGLALTMVGAAITHVRRAEYQMIVSNVVLLALATFVAFGRFIIVPV